MAEGVAGVGGEDKGAGGVVDDGEGLAAAVVGVPRPEAGGVGEVLQPSEVVVGVEMGVVVPPVGDVQA